MASKNDDESIRETILATIEASLDAQLRAVRRLRVAPEKSNAGRAKEGMSQVDMAEDILRREGGPLHVSEIIARIKKIHRVEVDRESLVSALSKKVQRGDRFIRQGPNEFALGSASRRSS